MISEDLEFSISQYLDGTLSTDERVALEERLETDDEARSVLEEYRRLDVALKSDSLPDIHWDAFADSISRAIDAQIEAQEEKAAAVYRIPMWVRSVLPMALAASVVVATGIGLRMYGRSQPVNRPVAVQPNPALAQPQMALISAPTIEAPSISVFGPQDEKPPAVPDIEVAIGPGKADQGEASLAHYSDDVTSRPSHVAIASGVVPAHDRLPISIDMQ